MRYILTNEYLNSFSEENTRFIISKLSSFNITCKPISETSGGFYEGGYAIFLDIDTKDELRNILDKCGIGNHLETFVYYKGETYPEIIINEEILNTYGTRHNTL